MLTSSLARGQSPPQTGVDLGGSRYVQLHIKLVLAMSVFVPDERNFNPNDEERFTFPNFH